MSGEVISYLFEVKFFGSYWEGTYITVIFKNITEEMV